MIRTLVGIRLRSLLFSLTGKKKDGTPRGRGAIIGFLVLYLFIGVCFSFYSLSISMLLAPTSVAMDLGWLYFAIFNLVAFVIIFFLSIFETKSYLFECKDNELLLSMPINPKDIVISRIISVVMINYLEAVVIMLPAIIVFAAFGGGISAVFGGIIVSIGMLPLVATALSSAVGYLIALISGKMKKKSLVTLFLYLGFILLYFLGVDRFTGGIEALGENPGLVIGDISASLSIFRGLGEASLLKPVPLLVAFLITVILSLSAFLIISRHYIRIVTAKSGSVATAYKGGALTSHSAFFALCKKEFKRFFSSAAYMLNGTAGILLEAVAAVALLTNRATVMDTLLVFSDALGFEIYGLSFSLASGLIISFAAMNAISASSLSLEGKSFWLLKILPVRSSYVLYAKLMPHIALTVPASLITAICLSVFFSFGAVDIAVILLLSVVSNIAFAMSGLIINVAIPKFDFENEAQVVKRSGAASVVTLLGMLISIVILGLSGLMGYYIGSLGGVLLLIFMILVATILYFVLTGPTVRKYEKL